MPTSNVYVQVRVKPQDSLSGQPTGESKTVIIEVSGPRIDSRRADDRSRKYATTATDNELAEHLAGDIALHFLARLGTSRPGTIDCIALLQPPLMIITRPADFTFDSMKAWDA